METPVTVRDKFSISAALNEGWAKFRAQPLLALGAFLIAGAAPALLSIGAKMVAGDSWLVMIFLGLAHFVVTLLLSAGMIQIYVRMIDNVPTNFVDFLMDWRKVLNFAICNLLYTLIFWVGICLFVVPGIIWLIQFFFAPYAVVAEGLGPIAALRKSSDLTRGARWPLLGFAMVLVLLNALGFTCLVIGLVLTVPVTLLSLAYVYRRLEAASG
jgi:hypothetical protein